MEKENKKYLVKESELKEIIKEFVLLEVSDMHTRNYRQKNANAGSSELDGEPSQYFNNTIQNFLNGLFRQGNEEQAVDQGKNADAHQPLDVSAAVNWLNANAKAKTTGWCAKYVRNALNFGGLGVPHGMPARAAYQYTRVLPNNGWQEIPVEQAGQPGDVVVMDPHPGHRYGHIAMCLGGNRWASDFKQRTMYGLNTPPPRDTVHVYRYKNRV